MKTEKTEQSKEKLYVFRKLDVLIYLVCAVLVATLFFVFVIPADAAYSVGFKVYYGQTVIYSYVYGETATVRDEWTDNIEISDKNGGEFIVKIFTGNDKEFFNVLSVNDSEKSVRVSFSNCSTSKDCVHTPPLSGLGGAIICVPHNIRILPLGDGYVPPVTG